MFIRGLLLSAIFAVLVATGNTAVASGENAARFIDQLGIQTIETLRAADLTRDQRDARFRRLLARGFDIPLIGRFVLGRYWRGATPEQRGVFIALYGEFFLRTYASRIGGFAGQAIVVTGARQASAVDFIVRSRIQRSSGQPFVADWRVRMTDGQYRVIDIMVDGVSMAITQRSEFAAVARRDGIDGLLAILRQRTEAISKTASLN